MKEKPIFVGSIENFDNVVYNFNDQEDEWHYIYDILFSPTFLRIVKKLKKKNKQQYDMIVNKTQEICINPYTARLNISSSLKQWNYLPSSYLKKNSKCVFH
jgi:hypothetical protein